jgi:transcription initiation factor TFIID subunit 2
MSSCGQQSVTLTCTSIATPEPFSTGQAASHTASTTLEFAPIVVRVVYTLRNPVDGFQFVLPTDAYPYVSHPSER